jgi:hypothetical protein
MKNKSGTMEKKKERTTSFMKTHQMLRKLGKISGLSLSSVLEKKSVKTMCSQKRNVTASSLGKERTDLPSILPASTFETEGTLSPSSTASSDNELDLDVHGAATITPLSGIHAQELFDSTFWSDGDDITQKESLDAVNLLNHDDIEEQDEHHVYSPIASLFASSKNLETIPEEEDIDRPTFRVSFAPANDLFLRTLAMERATALSMSEIAIEASRQNELASKKLAIVRSIKASKMTILHGLKKCRLSFDDVMTLMGIILLLFNFWDTSDHLVASGRYWLTCLGSLRTTAEMLYDVRNDPMGAWLV